MTALTETDFLTAAEKKRREKQQEVIDLFDAIAEDCISTQGMSPERVLRTIAQKTELTVMGVKGILNRAGLYENNAELAERFNK